jgi:N-acetyl-gamma-glutamylphosphate reductase
LQRATGRRVWSGQGRRATGYVGGELVRLLARRTSSSWVSSAAAASRCRRRPRHLGTLGHDVRSGCRPRTPSSRAPARRRGRLVPVATGTSIVNQGPDFRLREPGDCRAGTASETPRPPRGRGVQPAELHREELTALVDAPVRIVGAAGCYPTATLLALRRSRAPGSSRTSSSTPSGVSGAGAGQGGPHVGQVNEGVWHRRSPARRRDRAGARLDRRDGWPRPSQPGTVAVDFLPTSSR